MIEQIDFDAIYPIWETFLWSNRQSKIETHSAMLYKKNEFDIKNFDFQPTYFAFIVDGNVAGVNSGHLCTDQSYRSRGLFVFPQYRGRGIGKFLLAATIVQGLQEKAKFVWSYPRQTSWTTYEKAGFTLTSEWMQGEVGMNAYCFLDCSEINS